MSNKKTYMKLITKLTFAVLLLTLQASNTYSQVQISRKYRIVAYKAGNPQVFSVSNEAEITPPMSLYVPNTFTPNGDGINDTFGVAGEAVKDFNIQVYNRWGEKIFESENANVRWDGTFKGENVPIGAYVYKITAQGATGKKVNKEGNLNVIR